MTDKLWLLPFGPDQIHLPALHSPDSAGVIIPPRQIASGFVLEKTSPPCDKAAVTHEAPFSNTPDFPHPHPDR